MLCWYLRNIATNNAFLLTHREEVRAKRRLDCFLPDSVTGKASQLRLFLLQRLFQRLLVQSIAA